MPVNLPVPYKSQWDNDAQGTQNDCGPASIAMILNYYGEKLTTDDVFKKTGAGSGLIGIPQMVKAIEAFGYTTFRKTQSDVATLKSYLDQNLPVIALVHYGSLGNTVQDKTFKGGHFFVVVGYRDDGYFVNDSNFWDPHRQDGDHHFYPKADFEKAWNDAGLDGNQVRSFQVINRKAGQNPPATGCLIPNDQAGSELFQKLVHNSGVADQTVDYLGLAKVADNIDFQTVKNSLEAREGKLTSCKNELSTRSSDLAKAEAEVKNRVEQVGRLETQLAEQQKQHLAEITAIKQSHTDPETLLKPYKSRIEQLEKDFDQASKEKGRTLLELAEVKSKLEAAEKGQFGDLTFSKWLALLAIVKWR